MFEFLTKKTFSGIEALVGSNIETDKKQQILTSIAECLKDEMLSDNISWEDCEFIMDLMLERAKNMEHELDAFSKSEELTGKINFGSDERQGSRAAQAAPTQKTTPHA